MVYLGQPVRKRRRLENISSVNEIIKERFRITENTTGSLMSQQVKDNITIHTKSFICLSVELCPSGLNLYEGCPSGLESM